MKNNRAQGPCPRTEQLSSLMDGELAGEARGEIAAHAEACQICGAMLSDLRKLHVALRPLAAARPGLDLSPLIEQRLTARAQPSHPRSHRRRWYGWQLLPPGLAAAGTLAAGIYIGTLLVSGASVVTLRPPAMAMFDAIPPGSLCAGPRACYPLEK